MIWNLRLYADDFGSVTYTFKTFLGGKDRAIEEMTSRMVALSLQKAKHCTV